MVTREVKKQGCNKIWQLVCKASERHFISIDGIIKECGKTWPQFAADITIKKAPPELYKEYADGVSRAVDANIERRALLYARYGINAAQSKRLNDSIRAIIKVAVDLGAWDVHEE